MSQPMQDTKPIEFQHQIGTISEAPGATLFSKDPEVIGGITRNFASFWESECTEMKVPGRGRKDLKLENNP